MCDARAARPDEDRKEWGEGGGREENSAEASALNRCNFTRLAEPSLSSSVFRQDPALSSRSIPRTRRPTEMRAIWTKHN